MRRKRIASIEDRPRKMGFRERIVKMLGGAQEAEVDVQHEGVSAVEEDVYANIPTPDTFLAVLREKTDFYTTETGKAIRKHLEPLSSLPALSEEQKITIALKYMEDSGFSAGRIAAEIGRTFEKLEAQKASFDNTIGIANRSKVYLAENRIAAIGEHIQSLEDKIASLQEEYDSLSVNLGKDRLRIYKTEENFSEAFEKRKEEVEEIKSYYDQFLFK